MLSSLLARALLLDAPRGLYLHGLTVCDLLPDIAALGAVTLLAPADAAFDRLPFSYRRLLTDERETERLFDLMEHTVVRGTHRAGAPSDAASLAGAPVRFADGHVHGAHGDVARVIRSVQVGAVLVHTTDACLLPARAYGLTDALGLG